MRMISRKKMYDRLPWYFHEIVYTKVNEGGVHELTGADDGYCRMKNFDRVNKILSDKHDFKGCLFLGY